MPPSSSRSTSPARPRPKDRGAEAGSAAEKPFWKEKPLDALTPAEWESLCDGCGRCCLVKLEDEDSGEIHFTDIACKLLDAQKCRCSDYARRRRRVHDCIKLTPATVRSLTWLPPSCAYRLIAEGRDLAWWHPLVSGSASSVHEAGVSVQGRVAASETQVELEDYPDYIVTWPGKAPPQAKPKTRREKTPTGPANKRQPVRG
ncbi:YcgN family cysteine cluster protein [Methylocapsa polymorpha]|uniref:UPF0260 protein RZS28_05765 n=1 Tax=Methylocapsa polymorpha TaxID=3080828 RepID=A0ABZ0HUB3_9HYPH|nr:YcgN family cysteine cluster protein [Methylocapsa sp. RX1]